MIMFSLFDLATPFIAGFSTDIALPLIYENGEFQKYSPLARDPSNP